MYLSQQAQRARQRVPRHRQRLGGGARRSAPVCRQQRAARLTQQLRPAGRDALGVPLLKRRRRQLRVRLPHLAVQPRLAAPQPQQLRGAVQTSSPEQSESCGQGGADAGVKHGCGSACSRRSGGVSKSSMFVVMQLPNKVIGARFEGSPDSREKTSLKQTAVERGSIPVHDRLGARR